MSQSTTEVISSANDLLASHDALLYRVRESQKGHRRQLHALHSPPPDLTRLPLIPSPAASPPAVSPPPSPVPVHQPPGRPDLAPGKRARVARYRNYVPEEETIRNDYSQRYVDGGEWPQNWVIGADLENRFEEYPKQQRLLSMKRAQVAAHALPPCYLNFSDLASLQPSKFDVIVLDPPFSSSFTWDHLQELPIPALAADPSFVFLWVGSGAGQGLERGREVLAKWGYRRCEDVVWVKTNKTTNLGPGTDPPTTSLLTRTKQHCLIGIRGTVRRSTDSWFVHCNVDTDVMIWEGDPDDPIRKPPEMYSLVENFCLGLRRLEIFGRALSSLRRGWVTVLTQEEQDKLSSIMYDSTSGRVYVEGEEGGEGTKFDRERWELGLKEFANGGKFVVPMSPEIEALRPKSPARQNVSLPPAQVGHMNQGGQKMFGGHMQGYMGQGQFNAGQTPMMNQHGMNSGMNSLGLGMGGEMDGMMPGSWNGMMPGMGMMGMGMPMMNQIGFGNGMGGFMGNMGHWNEQMMDGNWDDGSMNMGGMTGQWDGQNQGGTF